MINEIKQDSEKRMKKTIEALHTDMSKIRTGRANASLLDHVMVDYYGSPTPLSQVANITTSDSRTILVTPWEKSMVAAIEKAILNSDLGLNPATAGTAIRVPMPPLTEERRKELIKVVRHEGEQGRVSIRNIRRDANNQLKELVKEKAISEDDERRAAEAIQKLTDRYISEVDAVLAEKEKDLMEI
ncbi:TPA: ribosome recycling factor [Legionella pneumophila]|uniref:Ribosome-recycling factor n=6 Tax=Legionella pneumophila TaxID=446 RepID=RRF_LEGPH|nr:ribosome recycling factor [Legionella pneumophila]A5ICK7.1 RecName: Full=Ribosome-recycling factor; Short=RRF; AltName: Full=Ribosome-releasing factor [Legionella pneumophila str. Corby]Q5WVZ0.1 RecName: Full=Ribosome-recycling factor; Short=RRF; AltName: Full=Ribosome-releasing factor [Legionella pneumophila str. Lens]Q5ZUT1.1 RecName: Full=Ribosome-recycling factor; Short=RRF; AltName: Full=Ribosome-releasing factor [Legionella pneumophila subsp. pneumophila str. Philadelphia 1]AAU27791.1 